MKATQTPSNKQCRKSGVVLVALAALLAGVVSLCITANLKVRSPAVRATRDHADPTWFEGLAELLNLDNAALSQKRVSSAQLSRIKLVKKGYRFFCLMNSHNTRYASQFVAALGKELELLQSYGWTWTGSSLSKGSSPVKAGLEKAFEALKISPESDYWTKNTTSNQNAVRLPKGDPPIAAWYENPTCLKSGTMVAMGNFSPQGSINQRSKSVPGLKVEPKQIVALQRWSDIYALEFEALKRQDHMLEAQLEHVFRYSILESDTGTQTTVQLVTGMSLQQLPQWPGLTYYLGGSAYQALALLSTPHAYGVAWMLAQHQEIWRMRRIEKIQVFNCPRDDGNKGWCMYLRIVDL